MEKELDSLPFANVKTIRAQATGLDAAGQKVSLSDGQQIHFDKLCICTGASPKVTHLSDPPLASFHITPAVTTIHYKYPNTSIKKK